MRKILLCSLMAVFSFGTMSGRVYAGWSGYLTDDPSLTSWSGDSYDDRVRKPYWKIIDHNNQKKYVWCKDNKEHGLPNGTYVMKYRGLHNDRPGDYLHRRCDTGGRNSWEDQDTKWCDGGECSKYSHCFSSDDQAAAANDGYCICSNYPIESITTWHHVYRSSGPFCKECREGFERDGSKCVAQSKKCVWDGKEYDVNVIVLDKEDCSKLGNAGDSVRTGSKCKMTCGLDGTGNNVMLWIDIISCPRGTKEVIDFNGLISKCEKKGGGNNTGTDAGGKGSGAANCEEKRDTEEGKACCHWAASYADWNEETKHCICMKDGKADPDKDFKKNDNGKWSCVPKVTETCETKYKDDPKGLACCKLQNEGIAEWVKVGDGNRCICMEEDKEYKYDEETKKGECVDKGESKEKEKEKPDTRIDCTYSVNVDMSCESGKRLSRGETVSISSSRVEPEVCPGLIENMKQFEDLVMKSQNAVNSYSDLIRAICRDGSVSVMLTSRREQIDRAEDVLRAFFAEAQRNASVWKTEEGDFNTARLASDMTAGVVLGTVGGVVSASVIKKKQIEKGYEVLHCTIGGQSVADWGDELTVGMKQ